MEVIKKKILISDLIDAGSAYIKIPLYQTIDNLGLMTDMPYSERGQIDLCFGTIPLEFKLDGIISDFYKQGGVINYGSDSKLEVVRTYDNNNPYIEGFDTKRETYDNYILSEINGVDRVIEINGDKITYVVDAKRDSVIGTLEQTTGILYVDNPENGPIIPKELNSDVTKTNVQYTSEGWNDTNSSIDIQIQEEYLLGIINQPEVEVDVFIDRTTFSVLDRHLRLSEIESLEHLTKYGNGFYKINRD